MKLVYAKTLIPGPHAVPALMATTDDADILVPQLLDRGWALFGEPLPAAAAGRLVVGSDRLQLVQRELLLSAVRNRSVSLCPSLVRRGGVERWGP